MKFNFALTKKSWLMLTLEALMILAGVLGALMVDEWREDREIKAEVSRAVERLDSEIADNYKELVIFQEIVADRLERLRGIEDLVDNSASFRTYTKHFEGYRFAVFNDSAWRRASSDRIANRIDPDYLDQAFALYNWNSVLNELDERANVLIYSAMYFEPEHARTAWNISHIFMWQQDIWAREMLQVYGEFLAEHMPDALANSSAPDASP